MKVIGLSQHQGRLTRGQLDYGLPRANSLRLCPTPIGPEVRFCNALTLIPSIWGEVARLPGDGASIDVLTRARPPAWASDHPLFRVAFPRQFDPHRHGQTGRLLDPRRACASVDRPRPRRRRRSRPSRPPGSRRRGQWRDGCSQGGPAGRDARFAQLGPAAHGSERNRGQDTRSRGASGAARAARFGPRHAGRRGGGVPGPCPGGGRSPRNRRPRRHRDPCSEEPGRAVSAGGERQGRGASLCAGRREPRAQSRCFVSLQRDTRRSCVRAEPGGSRGEPGSRSQDPSRSPCSLPRTAGQWPDQRPCRHRSPGGSRTRRATAQS